MGSDRVRERLKQLKFIATMFQMAMEEISNVMGEESVQVIYRLLGERIGKEVGARIKTDDPKLFADRFVKSILEPAIGTGNAEITVDGKNLSVNLKVCPFQEAGIDISTKFFCTYTEGLLETAAKESFGNVSFKSDKLRAVDKCDCSFTIQVG